MKTSSHFLSVLTTAALLFSAATAGAAEPSSHAQASRAPQFSERGFVSVDAAGPYVERGTWRVQVLAKLGQPDALLPDGSWLYHGRTIAGTGLRGTLVVRFEEGRVSQLALATPQAIAAWTKSPNAPREFVARK